jgi:hypothetical protein
MKLGSRRGFIFLGLATLIAMIADALAARPAKADWPYYFVQLTCIPELQHFSAQSLMIYNSFGSWNSRHWKELQKLEETARQRKRLELLQSDKDQLQRAYGYYFVEALHDSPFKCDLGRLQIEVAADFTEPADGMCKGIGSGTIHLRANGRLLETAVVFGSCDHSTFRIDVDSGHYAYCYTVFSPSNWALHHQAGESVEMPTVCKQRSLN